jgi:hypothetical protein
MSDQYCLKCEAKGKTVTGTWAVIPVVKNKINKEMVYFECEEHSLPFIPKS